MLFKTLNLNTTPYQEKIIQQTNNSKLRLFKVFDTEFQENGPLKECFTRETKRCYFYVEIYKSTI